MARGCQIKCVGLAILLAIPLSVGMVAIWNRTETVADRKMVSNCIYGLQKYIEKDPEVASLYSDELLAYLRNGSPFARTAACVALKKLGPIADWAVDDLIIALNDGDGAVEREASMALGTVAINTDRAVPALIAKLSDSRNDASIFAARSLGLIGSPYADAAIPSLVKAQQSSNRLMVDEATKSLRRLREGKIETVESSRDNN